MLFQVCSAVPVLVSFLQIHLEELVMFRSIFLEYGVENATPIKNKKGSYINFLKCINRSKFQLKPYAFGGAHLLLIQKFDRICYLLYSRAFQWVQNQGT